MKNHLLLVICVLLVTTMACNFPLALSSSAGVDDVTISPHSGSGQFQVIAEGETWPGTSILSCYISVDQGANVKVYSQEIEKPNDPLHGTYSFYKEFTFSYTEPGTHALVCWLDEKPRTSWSDDFIVTQPATPTPTPTATAVPTSTPTVLPSLTLHGTFTFAESYNICPDQSHSPSPASAYSGTVILTVDYSKGVATATLEGSSGDVSQATCGDPPSNFRYDLYKSTITGTVNPSTGELNLTGEVKYGFWNSCYWRSGSTCSGGGAQDLSLGISMTGTVDPVTRTVIDGKIRRGENDAWGSWQVR